MNNKYPLWGGISAAMCLLWLATCPVGADSYIVYPDDPYWHLETRGSRGNGVISADEPRSGNASLKLTTSGDYKDWAFYSRYADDYYSGWGLLFDITTLRFDWYRETEIDNTYVTYDPWNIQTPVLRLLIWDQSYYSELVWERYYTSPNPFTIGEWIVEDIYEQNFWRYITTKGYTISDGRNIDPFGTEKLMALRLGSWADGNTENNGIQLPYSPAAVIYGLSVGVGSAWPGQYTGYVDNIYLAFKGNTVLNDNFELIPEPTTLLLLGTGLALLVARRRRWAKKPGK